MAAECGPNVDNIKRFGVEGVGSTSELVHAVLVSVDVRGLVPKRGSEEEENAGVESRGFG